MKYFYITYAQSATVLKISRDGDNDTFYGKKLICNEFEQKYK